MALPNFNSDTEALAYLGKSYDKLRDEIAKVIIGQDEVVKEVLITVFSKGHCLLVGVPGLAKTLLVSTIANSLGLSFNRIQFTPDLMPS
ncbi:MAG: AAA family ATPase, partial [Bacteroidetes bacterium]